MAKYFENLYNNASKIPISKISPNFYKISHYFSEISLKLQLFFLQYWKSYIIRETVVVIVRSRASTFVLQSQCFYSSGAVQRSNFNLLTSCWATSNFSARENWSYSGNFLDSFLRTLWQRVGAFKEELRSEHPPSRYFGKSSTSIFEKFPEL